MRISLYILTAIVSASIGAAATQYFQPLPKDEKLIELEYIAHSSYANAHDLAKHVDCTSPIWRELANLSIDRNNTAEKIISDLYADNTLFEFQSLSAKIEIQRAVSARLRTLVTSYRTKPADDLLLELEACLEYVNGNNSLKNEAIGSKPEAEYLLSHART